MSNELEKRHDLNDEETIRKIKKLPTAVGVVLMTAGVAGLIFPGPFGTPLLVAGGLTLAPNVFGKLDGCLKKRFPRFRSHGILVVDRFIRDMEKRYPPSDEKRT